MVRVLCQIAIGLVFMSALACTQEDPNPEAMDPIYADLVKRAADAQKSVEETEAKIKELRLSLEKAETGTLAKKDVQKELAHNVAVHLTSEQDAHYFKIRSERRRIVDKLVYKEAFAAKQPWPNPHEYSDYLTNQRVSSINMNWNARVPKLQDRLSKSRAPAAAEKSEKKEK